MQSDVGFLRTRKPPGPRGCLMEKPPKFLHPLGNFEGCSRHYASVLERFVVLMFEHRNRSQRVNDAKNVPAICTKGKKPWELLHYFSASRQLHSKDVLTWPKRNATMSNGAWKSDAVHHKGFCGNTSCAKELPVGERVELEYNDTNRTQKKTEELPLILTAMPWIFSWDQFALALEEHRTVASYQ